ncbi:CmcI family methyltransferase [Tychonema sp. LEGE 07203]|uniref:CmcI family methyltransferase n=1 Tax=Tychonema sp. LEGE 07203 TaxID=1828671 RepID=UPI0018805F0E|nr:CmcI family methyltransferase [Tychonema sp. LEGE 07203]MBE9094358.1 tetratricopeptide repeat protein [Tychonema sp. LEGE 07203]
MSNQELAHSYYKLAGTQKELGNLDEAIIHLTKAIELKPDLSWAYNNLGQILVSPGKLEEAIANYRQAIEIEAGLPWFHEHLGNLLRQQGKWNEAVNSYRRAIKINPESAEVYDSLGVALQEQGNLSEAFNSHLQATKIKPENLKFRKNLASVLTKQGKQEESAIACRYDLPNQPSTALKELVKQAWIVGNQIDLSECTYGVWHDGKTVFTTPSSYYYFLAGMVRVNRLSKILEIGTYRGGSILAMHRDLEDKSVAKLVTIDINLFEPERLKSFPEIERIEGDSASAEVISEVVKKFEGEPIDLIYIDGDHKYESTMAAYSIYTTLLKPKFVIFDDITLNDSMFRMWRDILKTHGDRVLNTVEVEPGIRPESTNPGFGISQVR